MVHRAQPAHHRMPTRLPSLLLVLVATASVAGVFLGTAPLAMKLAIAAMMALTIWAACRRSGRRRRVCAARRRARRARLTPHAHGACRSSARFSPASRSAKFIRPTRATGSRGNGRRRSLGRDRVPFAWSGDCGAAAPQPTTDRVPRQIPVVAGPEISNDGSARLPRCRGGRARKRRCSALRRRGDALSSRADVGCANGIRARPLCWCAWRAQRQSPDRSRTQTATLSGGAGAPAPDPSHQHDVH